MTKNYLWKKGCNINLVGNMKINYLFKAFDEAFKICVFYLEYIPAEMSWHTSTILCVGFSTTLDLMSLGNLCSFLREILENLALWGILLQDFV